MNQIFTKSTKGQLIELGIGLLPEVIGALKERNPNLEEILSESDEFADTLIVVAQKEKTDVEKV